MCVCVCNLGLAAFRLMVKEHDKFSFWTEGWWNYESTGFFTITCSCAIRNNLSRDTAGHINCLSCMRSTRQWMARTSSNKHLSECLKKDRPATARSCLTKPSLDLHHCLPAIKEVSPMSIYFSRPFVSTGFRFWLGNVLTSLWLWTYEAMTEDILTNNM